MMDDLEALREALDFYRHGSPATSHFNTIKDAARTYLRLVEGAETVWWCLEHRSTGSNSACCLYESSGVAVQSAMRTLDQRCRMVEADLHIWEEETE